MQARGNVSARINAVVSASHMGMGGGVSRRYAVNRLREIFFDGTWRWEKVYERGTQKN